jgi:hypothetical protein
VRIRKRTLWSIGVAVAAAVLVVLLVFIALGILVLPTSTPAPVSVNATQVTVLQGTNSGGAPWLGPSPFTISGAVNGYPIKVAPGATFWISVEWNNNYSSSTTIYSITAASPFVYAQSSPALPATLAAGQDDAFMQIYVTAPSTAGVTLTLFLTINTLPTS